MSPSISNGNIFQRRGGRVEIFVSGGAPVGVELATWYADIGICIHEGYGLTETSPVVAINNPIADKIGSVGPSAAECRGSDSGRLRNPGSRAFGFSRLLEPSRRNRRRFCSRLVQNRRHRRARFPRVECVVGTAVVVGDRRKFVSVLISPHFPQLEEWARNHIDYSSRESLVAHSKVKTLYEGIVGEVNRGLARYETLKKICWCPMSSIPLMGL